MKQCGSALIVAFLLAASANAAPLGAGDFKVEGWSLTLVPLQQTVQIAPLGLASATLDGELKDGNPGWAGPLLLPGPAWVFASLRPETLTATLAADPATKLVEGRDFALDPAWASVAAVKGSAYPAGTKVHFAYSYGLSRIDLIEQAPDGKVSVVKGVEDRSQPHLPAGTPGHTPLASVFLPNRATALAPEMINLIDPAYDGVPPVTGREHLAKVQAALAAGKPVTLVFFGDSITTQSARDFRDGKGTFVERFTAYLRETCPQSTVVTTRLQRVVAPKDGQVVVVNSGVGGNDTPRALARIETDVLAHKPDLVVVMFGVNDENRKGDGNSVPVAAYKANLAAIVDKVRGAGGDVLLMTTSMKNLGWSATAGNLADYAQAAREVAAEKQLCLVDNFRAWERLPARGYNYMVFLGNCINHPVDLGHDLFFRGLKAAFEQAPTETR